jgi:hypothetical protein
MPTSEEFEAAPECTVKGSSAAKCSTKLIREWLVLDCHRDDRAPYLEGVNVSAGGHGDAYEASGSRFFVPILEGDTLRATFYWPDVMRELQADFPKGGKLTMAFTEPRKWTEPRQPSNATGTAQGIEWEATCPDGLVVAGGTRRCMKPCGANGLCEPGTHCEPWPTGDFCAAP